MHAFGVDVGCSWMVFCVEQPYVDPFSVSSGELVFGFTSSQAGPRSTFSSLTLDLTYEWLQLSREISLTTS